MGFSNALYYRPCPFNEMPKTEVLTSIYVLSHLQHESQKEHGLIRFGVIAVWTVWIRFLVPNREHAVNRIARLDYPEKSNENQIKLITPERARLAASGSVSPEAYEAYLKGRYLWSQRTPQALRKSIKHFEKPAGGFTGRRNGPQRLTISPFVQFSDQRAKLNPRISRSQRKLSAADEKLDSAGFTTAITGVTLWLERREPLLGGIETSIPPEDQSDLTCVSPLMKSGKKLVAGRVPFSPTTDVRPS